MGWIDYLLPPTLPPANTEPEPDMQAVEDLIRWVVGVIRDEWENRPIP